MPNFFQAEPYDTLILHGVVRSIALNLYQKNNSGRSYSGNIDYVICQTLKNKSDIKSTVTDEYKPFQGLYKRLNKLGIAYEAVKDLDSSEDSQDKTFRFSA